MIKVLRLLITYLYIRITKGTEYIREAGTEELYDLLNENPTLEEVEEGCNLHHGIDINARFEYDESLLSTAIEYCTDPRIIEFLINQGFDLSANDDRCIDKVIDALFDDELEDTGKIKRVYYLEVLTILLSAGAKPTYKNGLSSILLTVNNNPVNNKLQIEVLELFIKHGADLNSKDENGKTILFLCDENEHYGIIKFLLENGANPNLIDEEGYTPLQSYYECLAITNDQENIIRLYLDNDWDFNNQNNKKQSFIFDLVIKAHEPEKMASLLLAYKPILDIIDIYGKKVADYATGDTAILLREAGANSVYNEIDRELMSMTFYWDSEKNNIEDVKGLLSKGANVNVSNNNMETPLYHAVYAKDVALIKLLLSYQPNINVSEEWYGHSILDQAVHQDTIEIATLLLEAGADINIRVSADEPTPLFHVKSIEMLKLFIKYGADINSKDSEGKSVLSTIVTKMVVDEDAIDEEEMAIYDPKGVEKIELLLNEGIKLEEDENGNTVFHDAARGGSVQFLKLLHKHKVPFDTLNNENESALQFAAKFGHFEAVKYLVELGIDINTIDEYEATALYEAGRYEYEEIEEYLLEKGADPAYRYEEESDEVVKGNIDYV